MKLNREEMIIALLLTLIASSFPLCLVAAPVCAFLWALSGSEHEVNSKLFRRLGVPLIWSASYLDIRMFLIVPIAFGFLSLGYGIPSLLDNGSLLGRFFWRLTSGNELWSNILTRGVIYCGAVTPYLVLRII